MRVDLHVLAAQFDLCVDQQPFPEEISGLSWRLTWRPIIAVNSNYPEDDQALALAHQLGHYILGHQAGRVCGRPFSSGEPEELAADRFAAEFLDSINHNREEAL